MAQPVLWMDIPAANTATNYPSNGIGGITTTRASALLTDVAAAGGTWLITGIQVLATEAAAINITITDEAGNAYVVANPLAGAAVNTTWPMPMSIGIATAAAGISFLAAAAWPHPTGLECGRLFSVALSASTTFSVRVLFQVSF